MKAFREDSVGVLSVKMIIPWSSQTRHIWAIDFSLLECRKCLHCCVLTYRKSPAY